MARIRLVLAYTAILTLILSAPASANSSVVADPSGDAAAGSPAYVDIVQAKVTDQIGRGMYYFSMGLAGPIPATPPDSFLAYNWFVDSSSTPAPEFVVVVRWCTARTAPACAVGPLPRWEAFVNDFSGRPVRYFSSFSVNGSVVKAFVDHAWLGDPAAFDWWTFSRTVPANAGLPVDRAPNTGRASFSR